MEDTAQKLSVILRKAETRPAKVTKDELISLAQHFEAQCSAYFKALRSEANRLKNLQGKVDKLEAENKELKAWKAQYKTDTFAQHYGTGVRLASEFFQSTSSKLGARFESLNAQLAVLTDHLMRRTADLDDERKRSAALRVELERYRERLREKEVENARLKNELSFLYRKRERSGHEAEGQKAHEDALRYIKAAQAAGPFTETRRMMGAHLQPLHLEPGPSREEFKPLAADIVRLQDFIGYKFTGLDNRLASLQKLQESENEAQEERAEQVHKKLGILFISLILLTIITLAGFFR